MTRTADVVVVGGGVIGCAVARELARRGARVVVVERGEAGAEATSAAAGMVAPQAEAEGPGPVVTLGVESRRRYARWARALGEESGIDVEYRTGGIVYVVFTAADERVLSARARWQRAAGLRVARITPARARRLMPPLATDARAAFHFPDDHRLNNERLGAAVALAARRAGAAVQERTRALSVAAVGGRVAGVETERGRIATPVVVNAAGAWAAGLRLPRGVEAPPVFPVRGQMLVLRGRRGLVPRPLYSRRGYLVPRLDGRVLAGSTLERAGYDKRVTLGAAADILAAARTMAPALAGLTLEGMYAGFRPATPDHRPLIGPAADLRGLYYATGHYRSGLLLAPATAEAIADLVLGGETRLPIDGMSPLRFVSGRRRRRSLARP